ncbi:MAG: DUF6448 family protein [Deltaproteobacteria bacterium]|nr:DUF6448 family protein [Deltaproteobacteria bacterium]
MKSVKAAIVFVGLSALFSFLLFLPAVTFAHCDGLDGPVVMAAKKALESGKVNPVLIWVQKKDEQTIRDAFGKTMAVRKLDPKARELADLCFFETLVRVHRAGEGAPYTGLKPAGRDLGPAIPAGDKALTDGKLEPLAKLLMKTVEEGLHGQFEKAMTKKKFKADDVEAGREYIEAYVQYIHYVERLYEAASTQAPGHFPEAAEKHGH